MSPLPRRLRSFSLRTLMVLVGMCALAAWWWAKYIDRPEVRLELAIAAIWRENPNARIEFLRYDEDYLIVVMDLRRMSAETARLVARADSIRCISLSPAIEAKDHLRSFAGIDLRPEASARLAKGFHTAVNPSSVTCSRPYRVVAHSGAQVELWPKPTP
jgi:hypothetical protein